MAVTIPEPMAVRGISQQTHDLATAFRDDLEAAMPQLLAVLPKGVKAEAMASMALTCALDNPALLKCEPLSLVRATLKMATLGLRPGETCDIVPTKKSKRDLAECWVRVRGIVDLAVRAKAIQYAKTVPVVDGDDWSFEDDVLRHRPRHAPKADGSNVTHMAAMIILPSGIKVWELWAKERIIEHRDRYAKNLEYEGRPNKSSPWIKDPLPMWGKTVLKSLLRYARLSPEVASAINEGDDLGDGAFAVVGADDPTLALRGAAGALDALAQLTAGEPTADDTAADDSTEDQPTETEAEPMQHGDAPTPKQRAFLANLMRSHVFTEAERRKVERNVTSRLRAKDAIEWAQAAIVDRKAQEAAAIDAALDAAA